MKKTIASTAITASTLLSLAAFPDSATAAPDDIHDAFQTACDTLGDAYDSTSTYTTAAAAVAGQRTHGLKIGVTITKADGRENYCLSTTKNGTEYRYQPTA